MSLLSDFKEFAFKGNVIDLATGVIIGAAFGGIVKSIVDDVVMPPIALVTGDVDFSNKFSVLRAGVKAAPPYHTLADAKAAGAIVLAWGNFLGTVVNFVIVALAIFAMVKTIKRIRSEAPPAAGPTEVELLTQIRDLLKRDEPKTP